MTTGPWDPPQEVKARPGRVTDSHTSFKFEAELLGGHVHVKVRAATRHPSVQVDHSRGLCGTLVMAPEEWLLLRRALRSMRLDGPLWMLKDGSGRLVAQAGPLVSDHDGQNWVDIEGWPEDVQMERS